MAAGGGLGAAALTTVKCAERITGGGAQHSTSSIVMQCVCEYSVMERSVSLHAHSNASLSQQLRRCRAAVLCVALAAVLSQSSIAGGAEQDADAEGGGGGHGGGGGGQLRVVESVSSGERPTGAAPLFPPPPRGLIARRASRQARPSMRRKGRDEEE